MQRLLEGVIDASTLLDDIHFNWPEADPGNVWRRITNFELIERETGSCIDLLNTVHDIAASSKNSAKSKEPLKTEMDYILIGDLMQPNLCKIPPSSNQSTRVFLHVSSYSIDFGGAKNDDNRGLWVRDSSHDSKEFLYFYKLEIPKVSYLPYFVDDQKRIDCLLQFSVFFTKSPYLISINKDVLEFRASIPEMKFSDDFIVQNAYFLYDNLNALVITSCKFMKSLLNLAVKKFDSPKLCNIDRKEGIPQQSSCTQSIHDPPKTSTPPENKNNDDFLSQLVCSDKFSFVSPVLKPESGHVVMIDTSILESARKVDLKRTRISDSDDESSDGREHPFQCRNLSVESLLSSEHLRTENACTSIEAPADVNYDNIKIAKKVLPPKLLPTSKISGKAANVRKSDKKVNSLPCVSKKKSRPQSEIFQKHDNRTGIFADMKPSVVKISSNNSNKQTIKEITDEGARKREEGNLEREVVKEIPKFYSFPRVTDVKRVHWKDFDVNGLNSEDKSILCSVKGYEVDNYANEGENISSTSASELVFSNTGNFFDIALNDPEVGELESRQEGDSCKEELSEFIQRGKRSQIPCQVGDECMYKTSKYLHAEVQDSKDSGKERDQDIEMSSTPKKNVGFSIKRKHKKHLSQTKAGQGSRSQEIIQQSCGNKRSRIQCRYGDKCKQYRKQKCKYLHAKHKTI